MLVPVLGSACSTAAALWYSHRGRCSLGLPILQFLRPDSSVHKGSEHTQRTYSCLIRFHSTLLLLAFDYLCILAGLFFQFEYRGFHFKKLLSVDFCRDDFVLFIGIVEIIDFQIDWVYQCHMIS